MRRSSEATHFHSTVNWTRLLDLRKVDKLGARAVEVLKGIRAAGIDTFVASTIIHEVMYIQAGKQYASTSSNISTALQNYDGPLERQHVDGRLKFRFPNGADHKVVMSPKPTADDLLVGICERFYRATDHVAKRRKGKHCIDFSDEYDVQDVFGLVLKSVYDDVRDEEWTPSYAGGASRIDFVVVDIQTAAELKRARPKQAIADELTLDIARYAKNPDVKKLVCFVYDPDGILRRDASQIEIDLSGRHEVRGHGLDVIVLVRPK